MASQLWRKTRLWCSVWGNQEVLSWMWWTLWKWQSLRKPGSPILNVVNIVKVAKFEETRKSYPECGEQCESGKVWGNQEVLSWMWWTVWKWQSLRKPGSPILNVVNSVKVAKFEETRKSYPECGEQCESGKVWGNQEVLSWMWWTLWKWQSLRKPGSPILNVVNSVKVAKFEETRKSYPECGEQCESGKVWGNQEVLSWMWWTLWKWQSLRKPGSPILNVVNSVKVAKFEETRKSYPECGEQCESGKVWGNQEVLSWMWWTLWKWQSLRKPGSPILNVVNSVKVAKFEETRKSYPECGEQCESGKVWGNQEVLSWMWWTVWKWQRVNQVQMGY